MAVHRVPMMDKTRQQLIDNRALTKKRKGFHGHSPKNRHLECCQKYPLSGRITGTVRHAI